MKDRKEESPSVQDEQELDEIGENKQIEMALSFDRAYSLSEVKKMMSSHATVTWYWIDDLNEQEKKIAEANEERAAFVCSEKKAYGIKVYDENGKTKENPVESFFESLQRGRESSTKLKGNSYLEAYYKIEFDRVYNNLIGSDHRLTENDLKIQGVVVTGDKESLQSLRGLPFVKASLLGVVRDQY